MPSSSNKTLNCYSDFAIPTKSLNNKTQNITKENVKDDRYMTIHYIPLRDSCQCPLINLMTSAGFLSVRKVISFSIDSVRSVERRKLKS